MAEADKTRREYFRRYRDSHRVQKRSQWRAAAANKKAKDPVAHRKRQRDHRRRVRLQVLELLGGAYCARCGFSDQRALQVDHRNGDGAEERRGAWKLSSGLLWKLRRWIIANPTLARSKYQVLCANCNWIKREEEKEFGKKRLS